MKRGPLLTLVLSSSLVSLALTYPTDRAAGDQSNHSASVSAGGASVSAGMGGASVNAGGVSVNAGPGGASVSTGNTSVSAGPGGANVSAGNTSVGAGPGGASVSAGNTGVSAGPGGASVSTANASVSSDSGRAGSSGSPNTVSGGRPVGDRSYPSLGAWFSDVRSSWFGERNKPSNVVTERETTTTVTRSSVDQETESSESGSIQVNRVVQRKSTTAIAGDGGSASAEASNVNVTEQR
jgi:hypothetical protein